MNIDHISPEDIKRVRKLDVKWAQRRNMNYVGKSFQPGLSPRGKRMSGDDVALMTLHKLRTRVGNKRERAASLLWLKNGGFSGLWNEKI